MRHIRLIKMDRKEEIPLNVYYSAEHDNFFYNGPNKENLNKGMGDKFYRIWKPRWKEFPNKGE